MSRTVKSLRERWSNFSSLAEVIGLPAAITYRLQNRAGSLGRDVYTIRPRGVDHRLFVRRHTSDLDVFNQVFLEREYDCLDDCRDVRLVVDCGANVGYSSAYFLSRHVNSFVIAVEPEESNFAMLQRNLAPYRDRAKALQAGIWSNNVALAISRDCYRDGREWTRQVRACLADERAPIRGVNIESLLCNSGYERISILKMDIEGAEAVVFSENYLPWLEKTDSIAIELHDDSGFGNGTAIFNTAISGQGFEVFRKGDVTVCRRPK